MQRPLHILALSLGLCAAASAQVATAPSPSSTQPALADIAAYNTRLAALKDGDVTARLALGHWCVDHRLFSQATDTAHEILDRDSNNRAAYAILQQVDDAVQLPSEPDVEQALKAEFAKRFGRDFKTRNSRHFLICYDTTDTFASTRGVALERAYDAFMFYFNMSHLRPAFLHKRLVVILLKNRDDYLAYAKQTEGADLGWAAGYYSQRTNRTAFYDDSTSPEAASVQTAITGFKAKLKELNNQIYLANARRDRAAADQLTAERNAISEAITKVNLRIGNALGTMNNMKTVHEAAHQLAFNTGIQTRLVDYPLWFTEGLACSFETEDRNYHRSPTVLNPIRIASIKEALRTGNLIPLDVFVGVPQPSKMDSDMLDLFYAESWSLFHYLYRYNREGMEKYLLAYQKIPPMRPIGPTQRLKLFKDAFGDDLPALQKRFADYLKNMPAR